MTTPTPDNAARATPEWSSAKPISEGAYYIRGFNICREEQYEALVQVRSHHYFGEDDAELCCNLHASTSEEDMDDWIPVVELGDFEWLGPLVPAATVTALEAEVERLRSERKTMLAGIQSALETINVPKMTETRAEYFKAGARSVIAAVNKAITGAGAK